jgi:hypothetical protein
MAGNEMIKRGFFDGPDVNNRRLTINEGIELPFLVFSISAESSFPVADDTFPRTEKTLDVLSICFLIE